MILTGARARGLQAYPFDELDPSSAGSLGEEANGTDHRTPYH